jgi:hypothetical protein
VAGEGRRCAGNLFYLRSQLRFEICHGLQAYAAKDHLVATSKKEHPRPNKVPVCGGFCLKGTEVDKILLGLFVVITGSLLLPAMRLARVIVPRRTRRAPAGRETISEVKEQIDHVPLAPSAGAERFQFQPLTAGLDK